MIKRITRKKIDVEKYTNCLNNAVNYRIYAEYWYLDTLVDDNWDCYVLNDYEAIMPLPYTKKIGVKFITQPIYCQQLGVFHNKYFSKEIFEQFEKKLHKNLVRAYSFNEENTELFRPKGTSKINQILDLNQDYDTFLKSIRKNRKQEIKKGFSADYKITEINNNQYFINLLNENYQDIKAELYLEKLQKLVEIIQSKNKSFTLSILYKNEVVASSFYIKSNQRLIQLCNAKKTNSELNYNTFIIDYILKNYSNQNYILDFEGSSLKGVNEFNASFRAETTYFTVFHNFKF